MVTVVLLVTAGDSVGQVALTAPSVAVMNNVLDEFADDSMLVRVEGADPTALGFPDPDPQLGWRTGARRRVN